MATVTNDKQAALTPETAHADSGFAMESPRTLKAKSWMRRLGLAGFLFFLVKGLLWLAAPTLLFLWGQLGP
jgi:hypothetical protein